MRIDGEWLLCEDGVTRPVIRGEVLRGDGSWKKVDFQVDTAADATVFSADVLAELLLQPIPSPTRMRGIGGEADSVVVDTQIRLTTDEGGKVVLRGRFSAATDPETPDMSLLGRDITNLFAVIVDRPGDIVCLAGQEHQYLLVRR